MIVSDWGHDRPEHVTDFAEENGFLQVHLPVFEISHEDGKKLRQKIQSGANVFIQATLDHTNQENTVEVDLWYATSLDLGMKLSNEFAALSLDFDASHGNNPLFTTRIATYPCYDCDDEFKQENCVSDGQYCGFTPAFYQKYHLDNPDSKFKLTGRDVII